MDVIAAHRDVGSYRGAAQICGTTHKTVKRIIEAQEAGQAAGRKFRGRNFDQVRDLVVERVEKTAGRISAKRLLPQARAAGYDGPGISAGWSPRSRRGGVKVSIVGRRPGVSGRRRRR